jgi:2',3'-cyclic-nucleotide 2'-phosphodiesterase (5'-nucleotidase family)
MVSFAAATALAIAALPQPAAARGSAAARCAYNALHTLQLIHSSDNESSFQDPNSLEPKILGYSAVVNGLERLGRHACTPSLHLTAGDHTIPGPFYLASAEVPEFGAPGIGDIAMYNAMRVRANGMGNHEFDGGIDDFARMLAAAAYPFLAANLDFSQAQVSPAAPPIRIGRDAGPCALAAGKVVKSCWVQAGPQRVGLIGRAPADFFNIIANPPVTIPGIDFVGGRDPVTNQPLVPAIGQVLEQVRLLEQRGVRRIVLVDHAQDFTGDPIRTRDLRGVDVIVTAGSTGFMADPEPNGPFHLLRPGDAPGIPYPTVREDADGNTVLVVNSDQLYRYVGNLIVEFDRWGRIRSWREDASGPVATDAAGQAALAELVGPIAPDPMVEEVFAALSETPIIQNAFAVVGTTAFPLNGLRADVRGRETNLGRLAADSSLWFARTLDVEIPVDVALKNGGGIRDSILGPAITRLTVQAALLFDNKLAVVELTGDQLLAAMENAVSRVPALDGRFPQVAGIELEYDASRPGLQGRASVTTPSRVRTLRITRADGTVDALVEDFETQGDLARTFGMVTNDFLLTGGDGYAAFAAGRRVLTTALGEQRILEEYLRDGLGGPVAIPDPPAPPRVIRLD